MNPIDVGKQAYDDGEPRWRNPYNRGTPEFVEWLRGWRQAEVEELRLLAEKRG